MIPEENVIPEQSIQEDNLSPKENTQQESVVIKDVSLADDVNDCVADTTIVSIIRLFDLHFLQVEELHSFL